MCIFLYGAAMFYNGAKEEFVVIVKQMQVNHVPYVLHSIQSSNSNNSNSNNSKNKSKNNRSFLIF